MESPKSLYIFINSDDRISGSPSNFRVSLRNSAFGYNAQVKIGLDEIYFEALQYPINSNNNKIVFSEDGGANYLTATITPGDYNLTTIVTAVKAALDAVGSFTYTVSINAATYIMTISTPIPDTSIIDRNLTTAYKCLGISNTGFTADQSVHTGTQPVIIDDSSFVYLESSFATENVFTSTFSYQIMELINLEGPFGSQISYSANEQNNFVDCGEQRLNNIEFRLLNPDGTQYDLPDNARVAIKLRVIVI
jgi:hypothetical protein